MWFQLLGTSTQCFGPTRSPVGATKIFMWKKNNRFRNAKLSENVVLKVLLKERQTGYQIVKTEVHSRFRSNQVWGCFIKYRPKENDIDGILWYACNCPNGERTVGACCRIAAIIFYLAHGHYRSRIVVPNEILTTCLELHQNWKTSWFARKWRRLGIWYIPVLAQCKSLSSHIPSGSG